MGWGDGGGGTGIGGGDMGYGNIWEGIRGVVVFKIK